MTEEKTIIVVINNNRHHKARACWQVLVRAHSRIGDEMKKRRVDSEIGAATACIEGDKLPAELWANVLGYLYFDEVLACVAVNKFFCNDIPPHLRHLCIRTGKNMDLGPNIVERFSMVSRVFVDILQWGQYEEPAWLDDAALQYLVPFISRLPNLEKCYLVDGGRSEKTTDNICIGDPSCLQGGCNEPGSDEKFASLILSVCKAFNSGLLSDRVWFDGLITVQELCNTDGYCAWKDSARITSYRDDVSCQMCDMVCTSFPLWQLLRFTYEYIPCIDLETRMRIVQFRDELSFEDNLTKALLMALLMEMQRYGTYEALCPPDFTTAGHAIQYYEEQTDKMQALISRGARANDPTIRDFFVNKNNARVGYQHNFFIGSKRIIELKTFNAIRGLGINVTQEDFVIIDKSDRRTDYNSFMHAQNSRKRLNDGCPISEICGIRYEVGTILHEIPDNQEPLIVKNRVFERLQEWLGVDLSHRKREIEALTEQVGQEMADSSASSDSDS